MNLEGLFWVVVFALVVIAGGVVAYLYIDYRAGQRQARISRQRARPLSPPSPPPPSEPPAELPATPRIVFGPPSASPPPVADDRIAFGPGEAIEARGREASSASRTCPVCRQAIAANEYTQDRITICPNCHNHFHVECWEYSTSPGRCPNCGR